MKYVALLRGINVGGKHTVDMAGLKELFEAAGCAQVVTYLNTGNVVFEASAKPSAQALQKRVSSTFGGCASIGTRCQHRVPGSRIYPRKLAQRY